ncbi:Protein of unknown function [Gryllus bimaculatus]|nr:Protein of unknown function [Gryllus bimaculatus]
MDKKTPKERPKQVAGVSVEAHTVLTVEHVHGHGDCGQAAHGARVVARVGAEGARHRQRGHHRPRRRAGVHAAHTTQHLHLPHVSCPSSGSRHCGFQAKDVTRVPALPRRSRFSFPLDPHDFRTGVDGAESARLRWQHCDLHTQSVVIGSEASSAFLRCTRKTSTRTVETPQLNTHKTKMRHCFDHSLRVTKGKPNKNLDTRQGSLEAKSRGLTCDPEVHLPHARRVRGHLALVQPLVAPRHVHDLQAPVAGVAEAQADALVRAVLHLPHRQQVHRVRLAVHPRHLRTPTRTRTRTRQSATRTPAPAQAHRAHSRSASASDRMAGDLRSSLKRTAEYWRRGGWKGKWKGGWPCGGRRGGRAGGREGGRAGGRALRAVAGGWQWRVAAWGRGVAGRWRAVAGRGGTGGVACGWPGGAGGGQAGGWAGAGGLAWRCVAVCLAGGGRWQAVAGTVVAGGGAGGGGGRAGWLAVAGRGAGRRRRGRPAENEARVGGGGDLVKRRAGGVVILPFLLALALADHRRSLGR